MSTVKDIFDDSMESQDDRRRTRTLKPGSCFLTGEDFVSPSPIDETKVEGCTHQFNKFNVSTIYSSETDSAEEESSIQNYIEEKKQAQKSKTKEAPPKKAAKGNAKKNKQVTSEHPENENQIAVPPKLPLTVETPPSKTKKGKKDNAAIANAPHSSSPEQNVRQQNIQSFGLKTEEVAKLLLNMTLDEADVSEDENTEDEDIPLSKNKTGIQKTKSKNHQPKKVTKEAIKKIHQGSEQSDSIEPASIAPNSPEKEEMVIKKNKRGKKNNTGADKISSDQDAVKSKNKEKELDVAVGDKNKQNKHKKVGGKVNDTETNSEIHLVTELENHAEITEGSSENTVKSKRNAKHAKSANTTQDSTKIEKQSSKTLLKESIEVKIKSDKSFKKPIDENSTDSGKLLTKVIEEDQGQAPNRPIRSTRTNKKDAVLKEVNEPVQSSTAVKPSDDIGIKRSRKNTKKVHEEAPERLLSEGTKKPTTKIETDKNIPVEEKQVEQKNKPTSKANRTVKKPATSKENKVINENIQAIKPKRAAKK